MLAVLVSSAALVVPAAALASSVKGVVVTQLSSTALIVAKSNGALVRVRIAHRAHGNVVGRRVKVKGALNALGVFVSPKAKFSKHVARASVRGVVVGVQAGFEVLADGDGTVGVASTHPSALGSVQLVSVTVGARLTAIGTRALGGAPMVRIAGVVSAIGGNGIALRLPGGINTGVAPGAVDFSSVPLGNDVLIDARVGGSGAATTFTATRWALLSGKDRFANPKKREVWGVIMAASGQHLTVRPLGLSATDFLLGPSISLGTTGRDDTVLVDAHASGANLIADHVILLAKGVATVKPTVTYITAPPATTTARSATFDWETNVPGSATICYLDGTDEPCNAPPYTANNLTPGGHVFRVAVMNARGWSAPADVAWTITDPVTVQLTSTPTATTVATSATFGFNIVGEASSIMCSIDGAAYSACATTPGANSGSYTVSYTGLAVAPHIFGLYVSNATDLAAITPYSWTVVLPVQAPVVTITQPASSTSTSAAVSFTATNSPTSITCALDGGGPTPCTSPYSVSNLAVGSHSVTVAATNSGGSDTKTTTWSVQPLAPVVTITSAPSGSTASTSASIAWTATNSPTSTTCAIDGGAASACTSPKTYNGLAAGSHTVVVTATNVTGSGSGSAAWTIVAAPVVTITAQPSDSTGTSGAVSFTATNSPTTVTCSLDGGTATTCASPYSMSNLAVGAHSVTVSATNVAGTGSASTTPWNVQPLAPVVTITSAPSGSTASTSASIAWTATNTPTSTTCAIDGGAASACTSPKSYTGLAAGAHSVVVTATNVTGSGSGSAAWTIVAAPVVTITAQPSDSTATSGAVSFTATNSPTTVTCKLDSLPAAACTSPYSMTNLAVGSHTVTVSATNIAGTGSASTTPWTVQAPQVGAPVVTLTNPPSGSTASTSASIAWTATNSPTSTTCAIDGGAASACTSPKSYTGLAAGAHSVVVTATNGTGSGSASAAWTIVAVPVVTITAQPSNSTSTSGAVSFTATNSPTSVTCSLDAGAATACTSPYSMTNLAVGSHTVTVSATNVAGTGSATTTAWNVQPGAPVVTITSAPSGSTGSTSASIAWTATNSPTSTTCAIDGGAASACTSPKSYTGLAAGAHSVVVTATNVTGSGSASAAWTIVALPVVTITAQPSTSTSTSGVVSFTTTNSPTSVTCSLDGGTATACTSPYSMTNLAVGSHTVTVSATNVAGTGSATTTAWTVQPGAPVVTITSAPTGSVTATTASIAWTATNSPTSVTCKLDSGAATACTSPASLTGLALGAHTYLITATNVTGSGTATAAWTVVAQPPTVTLTSTPVSTNAPSSATFQWTTGGGAPTSTTCSLDSAPAVACASGQSYSSLTAGSHTFAVTVSNSGGSATASYSWSVAQPVSPPTISLTQAPTPTTTATTATIAWTTTGTISSTTCTYDGVAYTPCTTPVNIASVAVGSHSFVVTVTNTGGSASQTASWTVSAGSGSPPVNTALPVFSPSTWKPRSGKSGTTGSITNGTWTNSPTSYSYQWYRCLNSSSFASCQTGAGTGPSNGGITNYPGPIAGATSSSYHAAVGDIEMYLRCVVTATNAAGSTDAVSAAAPMTQPS